jgi:predicted dehydrogenase
MARRIKVGLVGLGALAQRGILPHLDQPDARAKIEPVAVCDSVPGRAQASAEKWGWREAYDDYDTLLARADVEAVLIATPIPLHYRQVKAALEAGKHAYVQKTMTTTLSEADDLVATACARGLKIVASPGTILRPPTREIRDLVARGLLGKVYWALTGMQSPGHEHEGIRRDDDVLSNIDPTWYYQPGGGPVYDMAVYCIHELVDILGPARRVSAMSGIGLPVRRWKDKAIPVEMDDNTLLTLDFGDNLFAVAYGANCVGGAIPRMAIYGSDGMIQHGNPVAEAAGPSQPTGRSGFGAPASITSRHLPGGETYIERAELPYNSQAHQQIYANHVYTDVMHLIDCILEDQAPLLSGERARHVIEIIEKGYQSAREGRTLELVSSVRAPAEEADDRRVPRPA